MLANEVVEVVGNEKKTYDEILSEVKNPDRAALAAALEMLHPESRVGTEVMSVTNKADDRTLRVRMYHVRSFNQ